MEKFITHGIFYNLVSTDKDVFIELLNDVNTFGKLINRIDRFAESNYNKYGYSAGINYSSNEEGISKFKGDLFEIFIEIFIKVNSFGNVLDISNYSNTKKDFPGIDAFGTVQNKKVAIQIKFLSNPTHFVNQDAMIMFSFMSTNLGVIPKDKNMILITTSYEGINYVSMNKEVRDVFQSNIRIINHGIMSKFLDNNADVWGRVNNFIDDSFINNEKNLAHLIHNDDKEAIIYSRIHSLKNDPNNESPYREYVVPAKITSKKDSDGEYIFESIKIVKNYSQLECYEKMQSVDKLSIILPTGTGKGHLLFVDLLSRVFHKKGKVFTICSHRIGLNKQHTRDMFEKFSDFIGDIGYIFVASETFEETNEKEKENINLLSIANAKNGRVINYTDIATTLKPGQNLQELVNFHIANNRSVVMVTTYHSLQKLEGIKIDVIYCDEADKLVNNKPSTQNGIKQESFMQKFNKISAKNKYFFTATPKDWSKNWEGQNIEFMNNESVFGERIEMEFYAAVKCGYIVQPYLHIVYPTEYEVEENLDQDEENLDCDSSSLDVVADVNMNVNITAKIRIIAESFQQHRQFLKERSAQPDKIGAKMLVKCKNIRSEMWGIFHEGLRELMPNIKIFAGGSYGYRDTTNVDYKYNSHYMQDPSKTNSLVPIDSRDEYLRLISDLKLEEDVIVLHCDILSEGINVKGFTNVNFISGITQTDAKALQNIGRGTRVLDEDRKLFESGIISLDDMSKWIKPFCSVTIPFWNSESSEAKDKLIQLISSLRNIGFEIEKFGTGSDMNKDDNSEEETEPQNETILAKRKSGIRELEQEIEELEYLQKLNNLAPLDSWKLLNDVE